MFINYSSNEHTVVVAIWEHLAPLNVLIRDRAGLGDDSSGDNSEGSNRQDPRDNNDGEDSLIDLGNDRKYGIGGAFGLAVTIVRADGLADTTPKGVFRTARKIKTQRRYVRVSLSCTREGKEVLASAVTPSISGNGPGCRWGNEESAGEVVFLRINPDALEAFRDDGEDDYLADTIEKYCELDVEAWSDQSEGGEHDIMLGRGQLAGQDLKHADGGDSRWVVLSRNGKTKGRVEIFVSETTTPPRAAIGDTDQPGSNGGEMVPASTIEGAIDASDIERELAPKRDNRVDDGSQGNNIVSTNETQDACDQGRAKSRPPKWGLLRMPHLNNTLNVSLTRAAKQETTAQISHAHTQPQDDVSQEEDSDALDAEEDSAQTPLDTCKPARRVTNEKKTPGNNSRHGQQALLGARHGMKLLKESLQAKLAGASGKTRLERGSDQDGTEDELLPEGGERCENILGCPPAGSGSVSLSCNDMRPFEYGPESSAMLGEDQSLAFHGQVADDSTREVRMDGDFVEDGDRPTIVPADSHGNERAPHQTARRDSVTAGGGPNERRGSDRRENDPSPLKSLHRELGDSRRAPPSDEGGQSDGSEGVDNISDSSSDSAMAESGHSDESTAGEASAPPVALAVTHQTAQKDPLAECEGSDERRVSDRHENSSSPLRSLLQKVGGSRRAAMGNQSGRGDGSEGVDIAPDSSSDSVTAESGYAHEDTTDNASTPPGTSVMMAAATRLKTTLSSPALAATLKGFGWNAWKEGGKDDAPPFGATGDPIDGTLPSALPRASDVRGFKDYFDEEVGLSSDSDIDPLSSPVTALFVTIFRADGLPENLTKGNFGRTKKDATQDPYVRLKICDSTRATSAVKGGGSACKWGKNKEGELVELPLANAKFPEGGLHSLNLVVEVWNQESEGRDKDILLGRTEIMLGECLGQKPVWADLEIKRKQRGRVKLSVGLKGPQTESNIRADAPNRSLHQTTGENCGTLATTEEPVVADTSSAGEHFDATRKSSVDDVFQSHPDVAAQEGKIGAKGAVTFAEHHPAAGSLDESHSSYGPPHDTDATEGCVPRLDLEGGSVSSKLAHDEASAENIQRTLPSDVVRELDAADKVLATGEGVFRVNMKNESDAADVASPTANVTALIDNGPKMCGVKPAFTPETVTIAVLVTKAQPLPIPFSKTALGRQTNNATQNPYCVLSICGSKEATSAFPEGDSERHREGADGESVNLLVSHADLTAAGWGHIPAEGPYLTVEVWNQDSASRQEDVFIGSTDVPLKDYLGCGAKWVDVGRRRNSRGRVEIIVSCPALQQGMLIDTASADIEPTLPRVEEATLKTADTAKETAPVPSELSELEHSGEPVEEPEMERDQQICGNVTVNVEQESGEDAHFKLCGEAACNEANDTVPDSTPDENEKALVPAEVTPARQNAGGESLLANVGFVDGQNGVALSRDARQESTADEVGEGIDEGHEDTHAMNDTGAHIGVAQGKPCTSPEATKVSMGENNSCLDRRPIGGTATEFNVATTAVTSDEVVYPSTQGEMTTSDPLANPQLSPGGSSATSESNELQPNEVLRDSPSRPPTLEHRGRTGDTDILGNDRISRSELPAAGNRHIDGIQGSNSSRTGGQTPSEESCRTEPLCDKTAGCIRGQQRTTKLQVEACDKSVAMSLDDTTKVQRLERAREIARRRRQTLPRRGPIGICRSAQSSSGLQRIGLLTSATSEQVRVASTIQRIFRGRTARRHLRASQRAAVKIQASFRGHVGRRQLLGLAARTKRARVEEQRARDRRTRIASMKQVYVVLLAWSLSKFPLDHSLTIF